MRENERNPFIAAFVYNADGKQTVVAIDCADDIAFGRHCAWFEFPRDVTIVFPDDNEVYYCGGEVPSFIETTEDTEVEFSTVCAYDSYCYNALKAAGFDLVRGP